MLLSAPPAVTTPTTALAGLPVNQAPLSFRPSRSGGGGGGGGGAATGLEDTGTVRYSAGDEAGGDGKAGGRGLGGGGQDDGGLPGASVVKHRVSQGARGEGREECCGWERAAEVWVLTLGPRGWSSQCMWTGRRLVFEEGGTEDASSFKTTGPIENKASRVFTLWVRYACFPRYKECKNVRVFVCVYCRFLTSH